MLVCSEPSRPVATNTCNSNICYFVDIKTRAHIRNAIAWTQHRRACLVVATGAMIGQSNQAYSCNRPLRKGLRRPTPRSAGSAIFGPQVPLDAFPWTKFYTFSMSVPAALPRTVSNSLATSLNKFIRTSFSSNSIICVWFIPVLCKLCSLVFRCDTNRLRLFRCWEHLDSQAHGWLALVFYS